MLVPAFEPVLPVGKELRRGYFPMRTQFDAIVDGAELDEALARLAPQVTIPRTASRGSTSSGGPSRS